MPPTLLNTIVLYCIVVYCILVSVYCIVPIALPSAQSSAYSSAQARAQASAQTSAAKRLELNVPQLVLTVLLRRISPETTEAPLVWCRIVFVLYCTVYCIVLYCIALHCAVLAL